ncbi:MAG: uroporphyrinogen-III C-methyltransferase [Pirellulales bacterium]
MTTHERWPDPQHPAPADSGCGVGTVYLVGAGPGDPGLLTLRGLACLQRADVVLYDYLVNPRLLQHLRPGADTICLGQHGGLVRQWTQEEINIELVSRARAGQIVVRLKGGDPAVFGRAAEECEALVAAGIPFEVVPGVTAALAAASYAGIPLTHRELSSAVAFVTGQEDADKNSSFLDYAALARFPGTLVIYMGVTTVQRWATALLQAGKPADTPAAIVRRCSLPDQQVIQCTLGELSHRLAPASRIRPPVVVILGPVVPLSERLSWFARRPLWGQRILVTRPAEQGDELAQPLQDLGADVIVRPAIELGPPDDWTPVDAAARQLADRSAPATDWLVFSSSNGVRSFLDRLAVLGLDLRILGRTRLAAIGPGTARELARYRLQADLQPTEFRAESLAEALAEQAEGRRFLLIRASRGRDVLPRRLAEAGGVVTQVVAYSSRDVAAAEPDILQRLADGQIDWVTVTSSAIARSLVRLYGDALHRTRLVSISPITSETLRECGFSPAAEAREYTIPGLIQALRQVVG